MRHFTIRFAVALLTFSIGIATAGIWYVQRHSAIEQTENKSQPSITVEARSVAESPDQDCTPAFEGRYSNYDYAFSVKVPKGMIGFGSCDTNHGFGIDLSDPTSHLWTEPSHTWPHSYLYVDASYNGLEWQSLDEAMKANLEYLKDNERVTDIQLTSKTSTRLSKLRAIRFVTRFNKSGEATVEDVVIAFRKDADIVYTIDLTTPASPYDKDKDTLNELQESWRLQPLP
jgi:hypothetical protein